MSIEALKMLDASFETLGINYEFGEWTSSVEYPYFVGEYSETPPMNEDGMQETTFMLNGFHRGSWLELEQKKEIIENHFNKVVGQTAISESGSGIAIFYENSLQIPQEDAELKRIQINLKIKEWKVN